MTNNEQLIIGIDIGTGSARAGLFDLTGHRLAYAVRPIETWKPRPEWAEQSSQNIWEAVGSCVREVVQSAGVSKDAVVGLGFDATCSLVVLDRVGQPLTVSDSGDNQRNIIVWMDHRALAETEEINKGGYDVLKYVGGALSPEMETPKLLWLKRHLPETWEKAGKFLDLADYLVFQSTGQDIRSLCTSVCKWTYLGHENRWDQSYFDAIGLSEIFQGQVGTDVRPAGDYAGNLSEEAANFLGLTTNTRVGVGIIDAHAGGLGLLGAATSLETSIALIGGTSACHMAVSQEPRYIPGVWGPYFGAMVPGMWLTEGGQSAAGALVDYSLQNHSASLELFERAKTQGVTIYEIANEELARMAREANLSDPTLLTRDLHVLDYHLGNRSPIADPRARGLVDGLSLDQSLEALALLYLATIQAIAYGTRAIIDALTAKGYDIQNIYAVGGGTKNPVWLQQHADITGVSIALPEEPESVLLGSAILAAAASGAYDSVQNAMSAMCRTGGSVAPRQELANFHQAKYDCYRELYQQQLARRTTMAAFDR